MDNSISIQEFIKLNNFEFTPYNPQQKIDFLNYRYAGNSKDAKRNIIFIFQRLSIFEKDKNKDLCEFSRNDYKEMFSSMNLGYASFTSNKSIIKSYLKWCRYHNLCDNDQLMALEEIQISQLSIAGVIEKNYFRNFEELSNTIDEQLSKYREQKSSNIDITLDIIRVVLYLAWLGIELDDTIQIKKTDVDEARKQIYIASKSAYINIDFDYLTAFERIIAFKNYNDNSLHETGFLIRTTFKPKDIKSYLKNLISRYLGNNQLSDIIIGKKVSYSKVYWSGVFLRATRYYKQISIKNPELMGELFQEDYSGENGYIAMYKRYRDFMSYCEVMYPEVYRIINR